MERTGSNEGVIQMTWIISGDFNNVLRSDDRLGQPVTMNEIKDFKECIDALQLSPVKTKGCFYTWCSKKQATDRVYSRIDWVLGNFELIRDYGHVEADCLEPGISDRSPIVLQIWQRKNMYHRPFKMYMVTMEHSEFKPMVVDELEKWSTVEEKILRQRSRVNMIDCGDSNSKYFYAQLKMRAIRNSISSVYNAGGIRVTEPIEIEKEFVEFFKQLMGTDNGLKHCPNAEIIKEGVCLSMNKQLELIKEVTHEEINESIKDMPNDKAPRVDGFPMLTELGFPYKCIGWIMECVTIVSYSLTLNGGLTKPFPARRGIRQRDPMSPLLFVIAMEYLQREMNTLKMQKEFKYHPKCKKLGVTHICFADDLLMFCRGGTKSIQAIQNVFDKFSKVSGLQASVEKSSIYMAGINQQVQEAIMQLTGYIKGNLPFKYLGVPLSTRKLNINQCLPLVEKITDRVRCCSARMLSYAGRLQLIKSVLFGVQTYWAQIFLIPKKIMKMLEAVCRTFLSTGSTEISRNALIAWDKICQPKSTGGLNVINMRTWNKAAVMKHLWALAMKKDTLWIRWAHIYYIKNRRIEDIDTPKNAAWVVRKIIEMKEDVLKMRTNQTDITSILREFEKQGKFQIKKAYVQKWNGRVFICTHKFI
ncbi:PREDICTED: uncharacterized protein LOC109241890 [Nicotiana attenuata]|uniref:uncharacterized protein LOC109241890 n=1 Tax=Nicotiana attenuata TaxID=49451 RepID=UPI000904C793|nr:PREDICTED: uncharacterized protein LOC109241890 [Nicotiana attenuata]